MRAGTGGIEPPMAILEIAVIPLHQVPMVTRSFLRLFVQRVLTAPLAILFELNFALNSFFVLARPVGYTLADGAGKFYEVVLRHNETIMITGSQGRESDPRPPSYQEGVLPLNYPGADVVFSTSLEE